MLTRRSWRERCKLCLYPLEHFQEVLLKHEKSAVTAQVYNNKKTYSGEYGFENLLTNLQGEKFKKNEENFSILSTPD